MIQEDLLLRVISKINSLGIPYMMTGGVAVIFFGRPRLTHDFDLVIEMRDADIPELVKLFQDDFYVSEEAILEALKKRSMFNIIHFDSGIKVDFWLLQRDEFDRTRFERKKLHSYGNLDMYVSAPEDVILKKLLWYKESDIQKHRDDALGILEVQKKLDMDYLEHWAGRLSVKNLFHELLRLMN